MKQQVLLPLETLPGCSIIGYVDTRDIRASLGRGRSISSEMFYAAWQNAGNRTVSSRAISIRGGREIPAIYRLDAATVVEREDVEQIVRRIKQRETMIRTVCNLTELTTILTITVKDSESPFILTMDDEACEEVDQRLRQMQKLLESYESAEERARRLADEAAERFAAEQLQAVTDRLGQQANEAAALAEESRAFIAKKDEEESAVGARKIPNPFAAAAE